MEKIINIDGRDVKLKATGNFLLRYKAQFGRDAIKDIYKMSDAIDKETNEVKNIESLDLETFYNLIWVLAKTADSSIGPPMEWLDKFSVFPLTDILPEAVNLVMSCMISTSPSKKK